MSQTTEIAAPLPGTEVAGAPWARAPKRSEAVGTQLAIGPHRFDSNLLLCPIAGYCDVGFRQAVRTHAGGLSLCYTDLVNPRSLLKGSQTALRLAETSPHEGPVGVQLYGCDPTEMAEAAIWVEAHEAPAVIDINMGCPANKVADRGGGAGLLRDLDGAVAIAAAVVRATRLPVTVKMRLGFEADTWIAPDLARRLEDVGVAAVTVHGRTAAQRFSGRVSHAGIARVVAAVTRIPVIGNGDVDSPQAAEAMIAATGCAGVMVGRAALSDPWLFAESLARLRGLPPPPSPTLEQRVALMTDHFTSLVERRGPDAALANFRQRFSWYAPRLAPCPELRQRMRKLSSTAEYHDLVGDLLCRRGRDPHAVC